ncbi:hypothetical protein ACFV1L_18515 [Kitasatospora sp. NPDC059646]|uniref:hypothetical protein n=1 Tax=Kitasatospora sp. NPDC059646 TaxID=3346893 RepID=UPI00369D20D4
MGIRLIVEVMDHAPSTLTHREAWVLAVLAEDANDGTRICWPGIEDDPETVRRMRIPSRSSRYDVLRALKAKGALEAVETGRRGRRAVYRIPTFAVLAQAGQGPDPQDATDPQGPDFPDANSPSGSGFSGRYEAPQGPDSQDANPSLGPDLTPIASGKPGPLPLTPLKRENSPAPRATPAPAADLFEAFWTAYPRKVGKGAARKAWAAALKRGADPAAIAAAVPRHAAFWVAVGTEPRFVPHPTTWLNGERYDDELAPPTPQQPQHQSYADRGIY